ncbi:MAG: hypothetical protein U0M88_00170 [Faecalicoccus sp.]|uniref:hypothetical protein n=1 Tax=Faecalicoccus sp. TaxID=1971758 RepID=UPI002F938E88
MFKSESEKKYIILKDGYNKKLLLGIFCLMVIVGALATSKMWLPDDRPMASNSETYELSLNNDTLATEQFIMDKEKNLGELSLEETFLNYQKKYETSFEVLDDKGNELPFELIREKIFMTKDTITTKRKSILQIGLPENVYYVTVKVSQKDLETQEMKFDYRLFKNDTLSEKGENYLIEKQSEELKEKAKKKDNDSSDEKKDEKQEEKKSDESKENE